MILEKEQLRVLRNTLEGRDRVAVMLGLCAGLRFGEIFQMRWEDVDCDKGIIRVYRKERDKRDSIPLPEALVAELKAYIASSAGDRLFEDQTTNTYVKHLVMLNKIFASMNVTFGTSRNTFIMNLRKLGTALLKACKRGVREKYTMV